MGRQAKTPKGTANAPRPSARKAPKNEDSRVRDLEKRLAEALEQLQTRNRELTEAQEQQTATAEILRIISSSPTDVQPVCDAIAEAAMRLCGAHSSLVTTLHGELLHLVAQAAISAEGLEGVRDVYPRRPSRGFASGRSVLARAIVQIPDLTADPEYEFQVIARIRDFRSLLAVPMLRDGLPIGTINVHKAQPGPFTDMQVALLQTFADQAVIAIENVRLFTELEARNRDLTATSAILQVISSSPTDAQPVFETIVTSCRRLLNARSASVLRLVDRELRLAAFTPTSPDADAELQQFYPRSIDNSAAVGIVAREQVPFVVTDTETDDRLPAASRTVARARGYRSMLIVPMLRKADMIGIITVSRATAGSFSDKDIALLQTFAAQAVIAIENVRLFKELEARTQDLTRSVGELRALGEVGQAISSTLDLQTVLSTIVARATLLSDTDAGVIYEYDEQREVFVPRATEHLEAEIVETMLATPVRKGEGATGQLAEIPEPVQVPDILTAPAESRVRSALVRAGYRALLAVPLVRQDHLFGGLTVIRKSPGAFAPGAIELLQTFATQSSLAIQNARLFREIEIKSRELEVASQHKSEFLANMPHELRTPLSAIIGYSELLEEDAADLEGGRLVPDLQKIATAAKHQLSLINDILDLSKVEAGRMELDLSEFDLPHAIENALILVRERASRRGIRLGSTIDDRLGVIGGDERKVKQVLLNLLSNALKFTPEGGRIDVRAGVQDEVAEVSVTDNGVGIAPEDQEAVFEEFRQAGTADKKVEGTGLGLALSRKFIELHGGRIWVQSQIGHGSTFTFTLPVRRGA
jgi:two-component system, NtrC family, sensor kinase